MPTARGGGYLRLLRFFFHSRVPYPMEIESTTDECFSSWCAIKIVRCLKFSTNALNVRDAERSLIELPRDILHTILRLPEVRRRCVPLCRQFREICRHESFSTSCTTLIVHARRYSKKKDPSVPLQFIAKQCPNCTDLQFVDCGLSGTALAILLWRKLGQLPLFRCS